MMELFWLALPWLVVAMCILGEAFFAASELSITSANRIRLEEAASQGRGSAKRVLWFLENPERLFGTTLLGTNLSTVTGSTVASLTLLRVDPENGEWWAMLLMCPLVLLGGEVIPKSIAQARANTLAQLFAGPLFFLHKVFSPLIYFVRGYTRLLYRFLGMDDSNRPGLVSRDELELLMETEDEDGEIQADEREMIARIFAFSELRAKDSMVSLVDMVGIPANATVAEAVAVVSRAGFSRLPVYEDRIDNIIGILHHLDLLKAQAGDTEVRTMIRPPYFVPETQEVDEILFILQREAASAAIVVDEFGGAVGLLTLEDVLEEIVGEINDEFDPDSGLWRAVSDGHLLSGRSPIEQLNTTFELDLPEDGDFESLAGFILDELRHIPQVGESVELADGRRLTVRRASTRAIQEVHLSRSKRP